MIKEKYRTAVGDKRYVRACIDGRYSWCEVQDCNRGVDCAQGECEASDLPADVIAAANERNGFYPGYVEWPMSGAA